MLKRIKSVSMLLALAGVSSTGAAYAVAVPEVDATKSVQQESTCTGIVKDATGETVIGASVIVKGTTNGTITGLDGDFSLPNVKKGDIIQISFVGYQTQEIAWNGQPLDITLKDDTQTLEEVVVTALGIKREKVNHWLPHVKPTLPMLCPVKFPVSRSSVQATVLVVLLKSSYVEPTL